MNENEKKGWWASKTTGGKVRFILTQVVVLIALIILFGVIYCRQIFGDEFGDKVLGEGIENGWIALGTSAVENGTKVAVSLIVIFLLFLLDYVLSFVVRLTTRANKKARTIGSLIRSLIHYITVIVAIAVVLAVWGVDVASIVAGLGVLTLIIGLGCQVLIQDVISGLFLVFDDYFDVGLEISQKYFHSDILVCTGGKHRSESLMNGLDFIEEQRKKVNALLNGPALPKERRAYVLRVYRSCSKLLKQGGRL